MMDVLIQAFLVAGLTAAVTTYVNVKIMQTQIDSLKADIKELQRIVRDLELIAAELRGRKA